MQRVNTLGQDRRRLFNSYGCMCSVGEFLTIKEIVFMQQLSKHFYKRVVPLMRTKIEMPCLMLVLERGQRRQISIGMWKDNLRECR